MRRPSPDDRPVVIAVGASDNRGATGVEGALKAAEGAGAHAAGVVASVAGDPISDVAGRLADALGRFDGPAVSVGDLPDGATGAVADLLADHRGPVVVDGPREAFFDAATLVTASAAEAERATDVQVAGEAGARLAGMRLLTRGAEAALISTAGDPRLDVLVTEAAIETASHPAVDVEAAGVEATGAGAGLAGATAAGLAAGEPLVEAVADGVSLVERGLRYPSRGVQHLAELREGAAARETAGAVADAVAWFVERDVSPLVPRAGMNVVGATPYAEGSAECAAVDGRLARTESGARATRGVRFGASTRVASFLLSARESAPELRFAANCRRDERTAAALAGLDGPVVELEGPIAEAEAAFAGETPAAALASGAESREPMILVVGIDARTFAERIVAVLDAYSSSSAE